MMKSRNEKVEDTTDDNTVISPFHSVTANNHQPSTPLRPQIKKQAAQRFVYRESIDNSVSIEEPIVPTLLFNDDNHSLDSGDDSDTDNHAVDVKRSMRTPLERQTARRLSFFDVEAQSIIEIEENKVSDSAENQWIDTNHQVKTPNQSSMYDIEMGEYVDLGIDADAPLSKSIEITPMQSNKKNEQNTPDSQITTAPNTPDSDEGENIFVSQIPEANYAPNLKALRASIANRIVKKHELRYMANLPELTDENRAEFKFMSIITADGLFQLNREFHEFRCILNVEQLIEVAPDLGNAINTLKQDGELPLCGLIKLYQATLLYSEDELKVLINNKPAYVLVDKNIYYIGHSFNINPIDFKKAISPEDITELESLFNNELQTATIEKLEKITSNTDHTQQAYDDLSLEQLNQPPRC